MDFETLQVLLNHDREQRAKISPEYRGWALKIAVEHNEAAIVEALLMHDSEQEAKIYEEDLDTALEIAKTEGYEDLIAPLLNQGAEFFNKTSSPKRRRIESIPESDLED